MMKKKICFLLIISGLSIALQAQEAEIEELVLPNIFTELTDNSDSRKGVVVLKQDQRIAALLARKISTNARDEVFITCDGYRIQMFSSNEQRIAKTQAYKVEERVKEKYPELTTYVSYSSPFWKVRVGDCPTNEEAQQLRDDLKREFPDLQQSIYLVKEQILLPE